MTAKAYERLQIIRKARGFKTADEAIARFGFNPHTYKAHENGARSLSLKAAERYAGAYKTTAAHLLYGDLEMTYAQGAGGYGLAEADAAAKPAKIPVWGRLDLPGEERYALNTEDTPLDWIAPLPVQENDKDAYAILVSGEGMQPKYEPGDIVCVNTRKPALRGKDCVVELKDGGALLKRYTGSDAQDYIFEQLNPQKTVKIKKAQVAKLLPVVGVVYEK